MKFLFRKRLSAYEVGGILLLGALQFSIWINILLMILLFTSNDLIRYAIKVKRNEQNSSW